MFILKKLYLCVGLFFGFFPAVMALAGPNDNPEQARLNLMDNEMNCIKQHMQNSIDWNDVCYINDTASTNALIASYRTTTSYSNPNLSKEHQLDAGTEVSYFKYRESRQNISENGMAYGVYGIYNFRMPPEHPLADFINVYHIDTHVDYLRADYKGSGEINGINDFLVEPRAWLGKDFAVTENSLLTPYAGVGYRYLGDRTGDRISSTGYAGYDRRSQYLYVPAGAQVSIIPTSGWEIGLNGEYDALIRGWQTSYYSQVPTGVPGIQYPNLTNIQNRGFGLRGSLDIIKKNDWINFLISPYIRYWNVKTSKTATASNQNAWVKGYEPANTSTEIGLKLGVEF
ncbi:MAG: hypothetical protein HQL14_01815 [Candidatus Omnitrophica bacterium]|nr:hypothetical protein [Candidatus Omnitrophota bacterium]